MEIVIRSPKWLPIAAVVLLACSSEDSLGRGSAPVNPGLSSEYAPLCSEVIQPPLGGGGVSGTPDPGLIGNWIGHFQNSPFASGSTQVELVVNGSDPPGRIIFGDGAPPPPATDPNLGYPPNAPTDLNTPVVKIYEGVSYTFLSGNIAGDQIHLKASTTELFRDWCALQVSYEYGPGSCGCMPNWAASAHPPDHCGIFLRGTPASAAIDCVKLQLCLNQNKPCTCSAAGCEASLEPDISLDLTRSGNQLSASIENYYLSFDIVLTKQ